MPNRKAFDEREKYDHSGPPLGHAQENDLKPDISEGVPAQRATPAKSPRRAGDPKSKPPDRPR